jgi:hypothetical protein
MDKHLKTYLNSIKCPVCGAQVDMMDWANPVSKRGCNFFCVTTPAHYGIYYVHWEQPYRLEKELAIVADKKHEFEIEQTHHISVNPVTHTDIKIYDIDGEGRIIEGHKAKRFFYQKHLFDFQSCTKEKFLNRIKTILVFQ